MICNSLFLVVLLCNSLSVEHIDTHSLVQLKVQSTWTWDSFYLTYLQLCECSNIFFVNHLFFIFIIAVVACLEVRTAKSIHRWVGGNTGVCQCQTSRHHLIHKETELSTVLKLSSDILHSIWLSPVVAILLFYPQAQIPLPPAMQSNNQKTVSETSSANSSKPQLTSL